MTIIAGSPFSKFPAILTGALLKRLIKYLEANVVLGKEEGQLMRSLQLDSSRKNVKSETWTTVLH